MYKNMNKVKKKSIEKFLSSLKRCPYYHRSIAYKDIIVFFYNYLPIGKFQSQCYYKLVKLISRFC